MRRSTDGGLTWGPALAPSSGATGLGGQPVVVRPNGTVLVPYRATNTAQIGSFRSIDGGASWRATVVADSVSHDTVAGSLQESPLPNTSQGRILGDYISTSVLNGGRAYPVIPVGAAPPAAPSTSRWSSPPQGWQSPAR